MVPFIAISDERFGRNWIALPDEPAVAVPVSRAPLSVDFLCVPEFPEGEYCE